MEPTDNYLLLSGIQHIVFCERQFALAYIEQTWTENHLTAEGRLVHSKVDDPLSSEKRKLICNLKSLPVVSHRLRLQGVCDVVEINDKTIYPVEYKRGEPKSTPCDEVQLCAQAICLEEMYDIEIPYAYIYYATTRHRHPVLLNDTLRRLTLEYADKMHLLFDQGITPPPVYKSHCKQCSLYHDCMPKTFSKGKSAKNYNYITLKKMPNA